MTAKKSILTAGLTAFLFSLPAFPQVLISPMYEFAHAKGATGVMVEYRLDNWFLHGSGFTEHDHLAGGIGYRWGGKWFRPVLGAVYINHTNRINGTNGNFILGLDGKDLPLGNVLLSWGWRHYSNGSKIFGWLDGKPNKGWNFVYVGVSF